MSDFVKTFSMLREENLLSLRQLSVATGISNSQLSKYSNGSYEPSLKNALKIANYFSCSLDFLFGLDKNMNNSSQYKLPNINVFIDRFSSLIKLRNTNYNRISKNTYLNRNTLYSWQHTKIFPKMGILVKLAKELQVPIEYLIGRID